MKHLLFPFLLWTFVIQEIEADPLTTGPATVLVVTLEFQDLAGYPVSQTDLEQIYEEAFTALRNYSYSQITLTPTFVPTIQTLPGNQDFYRNANWGVGSQRLADDADLLSVAAGFDPGDYDIVSYVFRRTFAGDRARAESQTGRQWINTEDIQAAIVAHETGHNYGMGHADSWTTNNGTIFGHDGRWTEYGNPFDLMGAAGGLESLIPNILDSAFVGPSLSAKPGWISLDQMAKVETTGTYRLYRFDHVEANQAPGPLALTMTPSGGERYTLEYRHLAPRNGLFVIWNFRDSLSYLLDGTPDSAVFLGPDTADSALQVDQSFTDPTGQIQVTVLEQGGLSPHEYLDLQVTFNPSSPDGYTLGLPPVVPAFADVPYEFAGPNTDDFVFYQAITHSDSLVNLFEVGSQTRLSAERGNPAGGNEVVSTPVRLNNPMASLKPVTAIGLNNAFIKDITSNGSDIFSCGFRFVARLDRPFEANGEPIPGDVRGIATSGSTIVSVGRGGFTGDFPGIVYSLNNGDDWAFANAPTGIPQLWDVAYFNGLFLAVGNEGTIISSPDAINWNIVPQTAITGNLLTISYGNGIWSAGGTNGLITSPNGTDWTLRQQESGSAIGRLLENNGFWYASGIGFTLWTSGDNWVTKTKIETSISLSALAQIGPYVFFGGLNADTNTPVTFISRGGEALVPLNWPHPGRPFSATAHQGRLYIATREPNQIFASGSFSGQAECYAEWSRSFFSASESASPESDPDRDGILNETEHALGTHPLVAHDCPPSGLWRTLDGTLKAYSFPGAPTDALLNLFRSVDLSNWDSNPEIPQGRGNSLLYEIPTDSAPQFFFRWQTP